MSPSRALGVKFVCTTVTFRHLPPYYAAGAIFQPHPTVSWAKKYTHLSICSDPIVPHALNLLAATRSSVCFDPICVFFFNEGAFVILRNENSQRPHLFGNHTKMEWDICTFRVPWERIPGPLGLVFHIQTSLHVMKGTFY